MPESAPNAELLRSLGRLVRGLSALFWGLPASLILCVGTAIGGWFKGIFASIPVMAATGLLLFGLWQIGSFQKQERPWRAALDRARLMALVNFGLCPFLYWWHRMPESPFFTTIIAILALSGLLFLFNLNLVLARLAAMLPDETLRHETKQFTVINRAVLVAVLMLAAMYLFVMRTPGFLPWVASDVEPPLVLFRITMFLQQFGFAASVFVLLIPLSMTMALVWKTKEVIIASVFDAGTPV